MCRELTIKEMTEITKKVIEQTRNLKVRPGDKLEITITLNVE